jgi:hypothetical protein
MDMEYVSDILYDTFEVSGTFDMMPCRRFVSKLLNC